MRKALITAVAFIFLMSFATLSFAQPKKSVKPKAESITGVIISIDTTANQVVVQDTAKAVEKTISVDAKTITTLKVGEKVKAVIKANKAESIKVLKEKKVKK
jgi:ABC-type phosphate/phosphonate transport system substrate-binding protein